MAEKEAVEMFGLSVEVKARWWVPLYIRMLTQLCILMRCEPDYPKVAAFIAKYGISQTVKRVSQD
ncbi:hypothetical protein C5952_17565 [Cronobacter sakazakii]|uniref:hypothetical protein n=1 Tax=Cronobacter TaxID=413496 RepID=UPI000A11E01E|nr:MULTISPECIES: hypothetical protein [Cronobacter]ELY2772939.1 hypothetical protein [Cronobacter sakazakii]ELY6202306.1 hypothetical protein [Cronobacter malonaticus]ELY6256181.1 hypothetical protein [Cronobacter malonaticus]ELY6360314.1 hypothetical protein [Cronobacter sakazakii]NCH04037.1 hypothetical protein [Cronobacter malonaticus]